MARETEGMLTQYRGLPRREGSDPVLLLGIPWASFNVRFYVDESRPCRAALSFAKTKSGSQTASILGYTMPFNNVNAAPLTC